MNLFKRIKSKYNALTILQLEYLLILIVVISIILSIIAFALRSCK